jgi:hypothetical protein
VLAPRGGLAGRVARCDDDDEYECPERAPSFFVELVATTFLLGGVTAFGEWIKDRGRTKRERMRQAEKSRRDTKIEGDE